MQKKFLPEFAIIAVLLFFTLIYLPFGNAFAKTSVSLKINNSDSQSTIRQTAKIEINTKGESTVIINGSPALSPGIKQEQVKSVTNTPSAVPTAIPAKEQDKKNENEIKKILPVVTLPNITLTQTPGRTEITPELKVNLTIQAYIMEEINNYRRKMGLKTVQTSNETCEFASTRAKEIAVAFNHDGFRRRISGESLPYANWSLVTENLAQTNNYQNVVDMWIASSGHAANMRKDTPFVCVENYENYFAYEGMKP